MRGGAASVWYVVVHTRGAGLGVERTCMRCDGGKDVLVVVAAWRA
jgi:hypothetical protein